MIRLLSDVRSYSSLCFLGSDFCAPPAYIIEEITTEFIGNLNARDLGQDFLYTMLKWEPKAWINWWKQDINCYSPIWLSFLKFFWLHELWRLKKYLIYFPKRATSLSKMGPREVDIFSPHFLFRNDRLNQLLAFELSRYFNSKTRISDVDVYDQYELTCFKHFIKRIRFFGKTWIFGSSLHSRISLRIR